EPLKTNPLKARQVERGAFPPRQTSAPRLAKEVARGPKDELNVLPAAQHPGPRCPYSSRQSARGQVAFVGESVQKKGRETIVGAGLRARPLSLPRCGWYTNRAGREPRPYEDTSI